VYSVDEVVGVSTETGETAHFAPFYAHRHGADQSSDGMYWLAKRQLSGWRTDGGTDTYLSFVDLGGRVAHPPLDAVTARLTCFNGDLPSRLPFGNEGGDFEVDGGGPFAGIVALVKPTPVVQAPLGGRQMWRLISLLSLNYLSLVDGGTDALREILRLHDFADSPSARKQIAGVLAVKSAPTFARIVTEHGLSFARGRRVDLELDEEQFTGAGVFLFASVLEHFLGLYASINSLSVLSVRTPQRKGVVREWPPRAGWKALL
jgi:type VI secretion system protein ImpG